MKREVKEVAKNARINLEDDETETLAKDFKQILEMFETLDKIDTENVNPSFHPIDVDNNSRKDKSEQTLEKEEVFRNTKNEDEGFFKGPSV